MVDISGLMYVFSLFTVPTTSAVMFIFSPGVTHLPIMELSSSVVNDFVVSRPIYINSVELPFLSSVLYRRKA